MENTLSNKGNNEESILENIKINYEPEIRIGVVGNVDSGKSTTIAILTNEGIKDNGKGSARRLVMKHPHEQDTGRTSDISQKYIRVNNRVINFIDLAGHEKYYKTTVHGINGYLIDYSALIINANAGIQKMTREHMTLILSLKIPFFIIYTKVDITPDNVYERNIQNIRKFLSFKIKKDIIKITDDNFKEYMRECILQKNINFNNKIPIFCTSNCTLEGIKNLKEFISNIPYTRDSKKHINSETNFIIDRTYLIKGIGLVISGILESGIVKKGDIKYIGPFDNIYIKVLIKGIHNNFQQNIDELYAGQGGCFNIRPIHNKVELRRNSIRRGMRLLDEEKAFKCFNAKVKILHHPTTITKKYQPTIHCGPVSQCAKIIDMDKDFLRSRDEAVIKFEFKYKPEYIEKGTKFMFREGMTKGFGIVLEVIY
jgi:small GTP-binding protein